MRIGYSFASKLAIGLGPTRLVGVYAMKKYVIDKRLKAIQKRVEDKIFRSLCAKLSITRTLDLQVRMLRKDCKFIQADRYDLTSE